jgi:RHS repeat-associated protein
LTSESATGVSKIYSYDNLARPTAVITNIDGTPYTVETEYDANYGRPKALRYPNNLTIALEYNSIGYLAAEKNAATGYVYRTVTNQDDFGNISAATLTNGQLTGSYLHSQRTGQMLSNRVTKAAANIHYLDYEDYDSYGNIKKQNNLLTAINSTDSFEYDKLHRITGSSSSASGFSHAIDYAYDAVGNILKKSDYSANDNGAYRYVTGTNRLQSVNLIDGSQATFGYDAKGNQTHRNGVEEVEYNVFNKPISIDRLDSQVSLDYDANWARYKQTRVVEGKTITTHYIDKLYEVEFEGSTTKASSYISDVAILVENAAGASIRFTHKDRLGSSATFTDHNGQVTAFRSYDPFGKPKMGSGDLMSSLSMRARLGNNLADMDQATRRGFTDHEHLDEVEIIHMNGRVYDYNVGRFMGVDPFIQEVGNSQGINPYSYVMNNPLGYTDPTGYSAHQAGSICKDNDGSQCGTAFGWRKSGQELANKNNEKK